MNQPIILIYFILFFEKKKYNNLVTLRYLCHFRRND